MPKSRAKADRPKKVPKPKSRRCRVCDAVMQPCDSMGHLFTDGEPFQYVVCPIALHEFDRDDHGFYFRKRDHTMHEAVEVKRPAGWRKKPLAEQPALFDAETMKKRTLHRKRSKRDLHRGLE